MMLSERREVSEARCEPESAEARGDLRQVLRALGAGLVGNVATRDLPGIFEQELQRSLRIRAVRLREIPAHYHARLVTPTHTTDSVVLGVPTGDPATQAVLEAT